MQWNESFNGVSRFQPTWITLNTVPTTTHYQENNQLLMMHKSKLWNERINESALKETYTYINKNTNQIQQ